VEEQRGPGFRVHPHLLERETYLRSDRRWALGVGDATGVPEEIEHRQIGRMLSIRETPPFQIRDILV
jgi:hypothetical protein